MPTRIFTFLFLSFITFLSITLFQVKYTVVDLETTHQKLKKDIQEKSEEIHVLNAEWSYLNSAARLQKLSKKYLNLIPIKGEQWISYKDLQKSGLGEYDRSELENLLKKVPTSKSAPKRAKK